MSLLFIKAIVFAAASAAILAFSFSKLVLHRPHAFYRFFVFELVTLLVLLNIDYWFVEPFSAHQIISWILLFGSIPLVIESFRLLKAIGRPQGSFENTSKLVKVGLYKYIRHPMYGSLLVLTWGVMFKHPTWLTLGLAFACTGFLTATAKVEEKENVGAFGEEYAQYMKETKMFIPWVL
jgi:protein-S-isoprenylcysteine O-methyltransferase Ste14